MLSQSPALSTKFPCIGPSIITQSIHNHNLHCLRSTHDHKTESIRHSCVSKQFLFSEKGRMDFFQSNNFSRGQTILAFGGTPRKRRHPLPRMSNSNTDWNGNEQNGTKKEESITDRIREPEISAFDKFVDKVLLLDGSSSDFTSSFPLAILMLTIITVTFLTNTVSKVLFVGLFLLFSSLVLFPSLLPWNIESGDVTADLPSDEEAQENSKFTIYYLAVGYLGSLFLTRLIEPFGSESVGVAQGNDVLFLPAIAVVLAFLSGVLSGSSLIPSLIENEDRDGIVDEDNDYVSLSMSAEESLMEIWDRKLQSDKSPDDDDDL